MWRSRTSAVSSRPWPPFGVLRGLLAAALILLYAGGLASDEHTHGDETYWTAAGWRATSLVFVDRDLRASVWKQGTSVHILTQPKAKEAAANRNPKLGMFLLGFPMLLLGVPEPPWQGYQFGRTPEWNRANGSLPARETLLAARLPVAALGVMAALWMFRLLCTLVHPASAAIGALLLAANPLVYLVCRRAMLDGPAYAFTLGAILATIRACHPRGRERPGPMVWVAAATCAAVSCKLNAGVLIPALLLVFFVEAALARSPKPLLRLFAAGFAALPVFVLLNPTLYSAPVEGLRDMLGLGGELSRLARLFPHEALPTYGSRFAAAWDILLSEFGMLSSTLGLPVDSALLALGVGALSLRARESATARVLLIWLAVSWVAVVAWPPVRWNRYFLPGLPPVIAVEVAGTALLFEAAIRRVSGRLRERVAPEH